MVEITRKVFEKLKKEHEDDMKLFKEYEKYLEDKKKRLDSLNVKGKELYEDEELYSLSREFSYIYKLLFRKHKINLGESLKISKSTKGYDRDIITILCLMKTIHTLTKGDRYRDRNKKNPIANRKLIGTWGLSLDKTYVDHYPEIWNNKIFEVVSRHKKPKDYEAYLNNGDFEYLKHKNTFHTLRETAVEAKENCLKDKIIPFFKTIIAEVDRYIGFRVGLDERGLLPKSYKKEILKTYGRGLEEMIEGIPNLGRKGMSKIDYLVIKEKVDGYSHLLEIIEVQYKSILYKYFGIEK